MIANPLTIEVPNQAKIKQVMIDETFESLIDGQALENPFSTAVCRLRPVFSSSLVLSKINILASTAIPIDKINPATPARVSTTLRLSKIARVKIVYIAKASTEIRPGKR